MAETTSTQTHQRVCEAPGCRLHGEYRAPWARDRLNEYRWFCLEHVREYNKKWDYFAGLGAEQIEAHIRADTTWRRPVWPLGARRNGNAYAHIVLRGGNGITNFDAQSIAACEAQCRKAGVTTNIMVDCSHANSSKKPENQPDVFANVVDQIVAGNKSIIGVMLESNIHAGRQDIPADLSQLQYGVSVTDGCIDWETTAATLRAAHRKLQAVLPNR